MALRHWLQLAMTDGIGPILIRRIIDAAGGSAESACNASIPLLRNVEGIGTAKASAVHASLRAVRVDEELDKCAALGVALVCPADDTYPALLKEVPDPPAVLYVKGTFEPRDLNGLAIVGSRKCSYYGREQAERFAALLAGAGFTVISGGARGIDSSAHRGAMSHPQGRTIAVLGSGIDVAYPPENGPLFAQVAARGAVVSEYPLGTPPLRDNFPRRNRIVSGMSRGVLVIEADRRSGALITARQACDDHGRTVFAVPGRVDVSTSEGPHQLIRDGAVLTTCIDDILNNLDPVPHGAGEPLLFAGAGASSGAGADTRDGFTRADGVKPQAGGEGGGETAAAARELETVGLSDRQRLILANLSKDPTNVDGLIERTALAAHEVLQELTLLSLRGVVRRTDGQSFVLTRAGAGAT